MVTGTNKAYDVAVLAMKEKRLDRKADQNTAAATLLRRILVSSS
jgi:hypothetical protein